MTTPKAKLDCLKLAQKYAESTEELIILAEELYMWTLGLVKLENIEDDIDDIEDDPRMN